ncbi:phosphate-binding protein [Cellvibrio mixtus]|uniref:Phosphate-binding protein n=1 Tax=Cellvibrio mixtus TaxID=39650 RepID=A0A266QAC3_9GAMM|nr:phosphate ABC transporter substrate-binding protein PstS family protein [Cellvibrio mixtus]OZY86311.1 phosphate-binding protein [Cellvibrio mixtus]
MNAMKIMKGLVLAGSMVCATALQAAIDPALPEYKATTGVSGNVNSIGSDTLNNLMTLWAEDFKKWYPNVNIQIQGAGSSTAPPALTEGTANFGPMSRAMKTEEIQAFEAKHGYKPTAVPVAIDVLAVYVNKDNPIEGLSIPQVDAIFSATRKCGGAKDLTRWGDVGLTGAWANRDFTMYSRNAVSGTYGYFKDEALCKGDFKSSILEQPGSASVVQGVSESINGIGYSGIGYITSGVRAVPLSKKDGQPYIAADATHALDGSYPLSRVLFMYINKHPNRPLDAIQLEFVKLILSKQGQETVVRDGYIPLPATMVNKALADLQK